MTAPHAVMPYCELWAPQRWTINLLTTLTRSNLNRSPVPLNRISTKSAKGAKLLHSSQVVSIFENGRANECRSELRIARLVMSDCFTSNVLKRLVELMGLELPTSCSQSRTPRFHNLLIFNKLLK